MTGLIGALQFLTRIPIRTRRVIPHDRSIPWFPVVGLVIGAAIGGTAAGLDAVVPTAVAAAVAIVFGLLVTGAFHEDGLADVADAFGGGWTREQRFEILKDPRHGTYGVAALTGSVVVRVVALGSMPTAAAMFATAVAAHVMARTAIVAVMLVTPPASESGLGADAASTMRRSTAAIGVAVGVAVTAVVIGWWAVAVVVASVVGTGAVAALAIRKIGGLAGDVLGATEQVVECLVMVTAAGVAAETALWWS